MAKQKKSQRPIALRKTNGKSLFLQQEESTSYEELP
jgi:hypothetical protein